MDSAPAQRRLKAIHGHLISAADAPYLRPNPTAGEFVSGTLLLSLSLSLSVFLFLALRGVSYCEEG